MIRMTCSACGAALRVDDHMAGRQAKCPNCDRPLTIPWKGTADAGGLSGGHCISCGRSLPAGLTVCDDCAGGPGDLSGGAGEPSMSRDGAPVGRTGLVIGVVMVCAALLVVGVLLLLLLGGDQDEGGGSAASNAAASGEGRGQAPTSGGPARGEQMPAPATQGPTGPVVLRVEPGSVTMDGNPAKWAEREMILYPVLPPRPFEGEPREMQQRFQLEQWAASIEDAFAQRVGFAHDGESLFVVFQMKEGIGERFERTRRTGALGYLYLDTDGDTNTGLVKTVHGKSGGFDVCIWLPTGFAGGTGRKTVPMAAYEVSRYETDGFEEVPDGEKETHEDPEFIAFDGKCFEMRIPFEQLGIEPPTELGVTFHSMTGFNSDSQLIRLVME